MKHAGKIALVTGGSTGQGAAIARRLSADGAAVAITYPAETDSAEPIAHELRAAGGRAISILADNSFDDQVRAAVERTVEEYGRIDILVNNAGIGFAVPVEDFTMEQFDRMFAINVRAMFVAVQAALPHMSAGGRIINTGSVGSRFIRFTGLSVYAMTKAAVEGLTRGLARDLGPRGITVNATQPGQIDTPMNPADGPYSGFMSDMIPLGRYGKPSEVADLVSFLASPEADYINGATLTIDGGYTV